MIRLPKDKYKRGGLGFPFFCFCRFWGWVFSIILMPVILFRINRAIENLKKSFPQKTWLWHLKVAYSAFVEALQSLIETFWWYVISSPQRGSDRWKPILRVKTGMVMSPEFEAVLKDDSNPLVILSAHSSNFVAIIIAALLTGRPVGVFLKKVKNRPLERLFFKIRYDIGIEHLYVDEEASPIKAARILKNNGIVIALLDQHFGRKGRRKVVFFGRECFIAPGVLVLAKRFKAKIATAFVSRGKDCSLNISFMGFLNEENDDEILQKFTNLLEYHVKKFPGQWAWMHRRWKI